MAKELTSERVRTEIARLIRLCRWGARTYPRREEQIKREREAIALLQELADNLGLLSRDAHPQDRYLVGKL